jgi:Na+(H+)/acetate symporter ActP
MAERGMSIAQPAALLVGIIYLLAGLLGFAVTGIVFGEDAWTNTPDQFAGFFDLNVFHNVVHLGIGVILIAASTARDPSVTEGILIGGGLVYILAAILGFTHSVADLLSIDGRFDAFDNWFHLVSGIAAVAIGLLGASQSREAVVDPRAASYPG